MPGHECLGIILRALELRRRLRCSKNLEPRRAERIDDARGQRRLRSDNRQRDVFAFRERDQVRNRRARNVSEPGLARSARVAGGHEYLGDARRLRDFPRQRMFAATAADDENIHR